MLDTLLPRMVALHREGMDQPTIAAMMGLSLFWVRTAMNTDSFRYLLAQAEIDFAEGGALSKAEGAKSKSEAEDGDA